MIYTERDLRRMEIEEEEAHEGIVWQEWGRVFGMGVE